MGVLKPLWVAILLGAAWPVSLAAQTLGAPDAPGGSELPGWLTWWSPIGGAADLGRRLPGAAAVPSVLTLPGPRVGSFWTARNPAGLPSDVRESYAHMRLGAREHEGAYRRPLDPGRDRRIGGSALGWTPLGSGGATGRVAVDYLGQEGPASADVVLPHGSNPFVMLDTLGDEVSGFITRLEGAGGWRIGNLRFGLGLGFDGRQVRTVTSPVPRQYRATASGVSGGLEYRVAGAVRIGLYGRWEQLVQFGALSARNDYSRVLVLRGYSNPTTIDLGEGTVVYSRRSERSATAVGASLSGHVAGVEWTLFAEQNEGDERQSTELESDPPADRWDASGITAGGAAQFSLRGGVLEVTLWARVSELTGDATRFDLQHRHFWADEREVRVAAEVRVPERHGWLGAVRVSTTRESRTRHDSLARLSSELEAWAPSASVEVGRVLPAGFTLAAGAAFQQYAPWGSIPDPQALSQAYRDWIAPELALYGTESTAFAQTVTLRWRWRQGLDVWVRGTKASLSAGDGVASLPLAPSGSRTRRTFDVGVAMRNQLP